MAINADAMVPVTRQAAEAHIPVIGLCGRLEGRGRTLLTRPEQDGQHLASFAVDWIKKTYGSDPVEIAVLSDEQNDLTRLRVKGIYEGVKQGAPNAKVYNVPALSREDGYNAAKQQ